MRSHTNTCSICTEKHTHTHAGTHTRTHTCARLASGGGWHCYIHQKHKQTNEMTPSSPPISSPVQLFAVPEAQTHVPRLYNLLTFGKVFFVGVYTAHFSPLVLLPMVFSCSLVHYSYSYLHITLLNLRLTLCSSPCFLRTCSHIKCLVSYLGPLTAPLCPSKTASGLVQTLSGNNRWLFYCLRSFTL